MNKSSHKKLESIRKRFSRRMDADEKWITINGAHVMVDDGGNLKGKVGKKIQASQKKTKSGSAPAKTSSTSYREMESMLDALYNFNESNRSSGGYQKRNTLVEEIEKGCMSARIWGQEESGTKMVSEALKNFPEGLKVNFGKNHGEMEKKNGNTWISTTGGKHISCHDLAKQIIKTYEG